MPDQASAPNGRPPHEPTETSRAQVSEAAGLGLSQEIIADLVGIDPKTLRKHYDLELKVGKARATAAVASSLFNKAQSGDTASMIFWMKAQAGWSEKSQVELSGPNGGPVEFTQITRRIVDPKKSGSDEGGAPSSP